MKIVIAGGAKNIQAIDLGGRGCAYCRNRAVTLRNCFRRKSR